MLYETLDLSLKIGFASISLAVGLKEGLTLSIFLMTATIPGSTPFHSYGKNSTYPLYIADFKLKTSLP